MFLFIDNYDSFSYNLVQAFYSLGKKPVVYTNDNPEILKLAQSEELEAVCISPGPSHPRNAGLCLEFLKLLPTHIPVLGVCLGHQLLGYYAGAEVSKAPYVMHGKSSEIMHDGKGLFEGLPQPMTVARYHSLVVQSIEEQPNALFEVTARGPEGEVMALQYRDRPWVGIQFHPESILTPDGLQLLANFPDRIVKADVKEKRVSKVLDTLAAGQDLTAEQAAGAFADLMDGKMSDAQAGALLMGLRLKGENSLEMAHAVGIALGRAKRIEGVYGDCIDVVGTGGDGKNSFNCSTATSLTLAGMGYRVVKHGNRAVSSACGSADALEALGFPLDIMPDQVPQVLENTGFAFLFAPNFHPTFKNIASIRKELGIRSLFNLLGPLINPARPSHLLLGVARPDLVDLLADTLKQSHITRAAVVYGAGGYDELTPIGPAKMKLVHHGQVEEMDLDPQEFGFAPCTEADLAVTDKEDAVRVLTLLLAGKGPQAMLDMIALNVGLGVYLMEPQLPLSACMAKAKEAVAAGVGRRVLESC